MRSTKTIHTRSLANTVVPLLTQIMMVNDGRALSLYTVQREPTGCEPKSSQDHVVKAISSKPG